MKIFVPAKITNYTVICRLAHGHKPAVMQHTYAHTAFKHSLIALLAVHAWLFNIFLSNLCCTQTKPCPLVLKIPQALPYVCVHAHIRVCASITRNDNDRYDLQMKDSCTKVSCTKRWCFQGASSDLLGKDSHLTVFCA